MTRLFISRWFFSFDEKMTSWEQHGTIVYYSSSPFTGWINYWDKLLRRYKHIWSQYEKWIRVTSDAKFKFITVTFLWRSISIQHLNWAIDYKKQWKRFEADPKCATVKPIWARINLWSLARTLKHTKRCEFPSANFSIIAFMTVSRSEEFINSHSTENISVVSSDKITKSTQKLMWNIPIACGSR
jgi:hypothetical protein